MRSPISPKSENYPEGVGVYAAAMSAEVSAHYPGNGSEADIDYLEGSPVRGERSESNLALCQRSD